MGYYTRTIDNLETDVRKLADLESQTTRHTSASVFTLVNAAIRSLVHIVAHAGHTAYSQFTSGNPTMTVGNSTLTIPAGNDTVDIVHMILVYTVDSSDYWVLEEATLAEYGMLKALPQGRPRVFRMGGITSPQATVFPAPDQAYPYQVLFTPMPVDLTTTQTFAGKQEWIDWIVCEAAEQLLIKDNNPQRAAMVRARKTDIERKIVAQAPRQHRVPLRRRDTRGARIYGTRGDDLFSDWEWRLR